MDIVEQVRDDISPFVGDSGRSAADQEVLDCLNDARRLMYKLGNWKGTKEGLLLQPIGGVVTLPFEFDFIIKAWNTPSSLSTMAIENQWYSPIISGFENPQTNEISDKLINLGDKFASFRDYGTVEGYNFRLEVQSEHEDDEGIKLSFNAIGEFGNRVLLTRTLAGAFRAVDTNPITDEWIVNFRSVQKPKTAGRVKVFINDPNRDKRILCAIYEAEDINPNYRRYKVGGCADRPIAVKAKKKYRKLFNNSDQVEFSTEALIHVCQAITSRKNRNIAEFNANMGLAAGYLNKELGLEEAVKTAPMRMSTRYRVENLGFGDD